MDIKAEHKVWLSKRVVSYLMLALLILCIVPAIYIGIYAHPSVDDYYYGTVTAEAWKDTGSFLSVIKTSAEQTAERYENWQGNFVAIFLMGLMPAVFGEAYYVITPILLILSFVLCSYFFYSVLFRDVMCAKRDESRILTCLFVLLSFELTLKPSDAFYWFNGGSYYCFFYSLMLLLAGCILRMICEKFTAKRLCWLFVCLPLAFLIGGSNYPTAFISTLLLLFLSLVLILKKNRNYIGTIPVAVVCMVSLLISMMAPGNSIRQESVGESFGAIKAILVSFAYGGYCIANSTTFLIIIILIAILPIMFCLVRRSEWKFSHPYIVILLSYCFFSAQATPVIYAQGYAIPYRLQNIIYFSYYIFLVFVLFYYLGYLEKKYHIWAKIEGIETIFASQKARTVTLLVMICILCFSFVGQIRIEGDEDKKAQILNLPVTMSAVYSLMTGEAKTYNEECKQRLQIYEDTSVEIAEVDPFSAMPELLYHSDVTTSKKHWRNEHVAMYYHKKYVVLKD